MPKRRHSTIERTRCCVAGSWSSFPRSSNDSNCFQIRMNGRGTTVSRRSAPRRAVMTSGRAPSPGVIASSEPVVAGQHAFRGELRLEEAQLFGRDLVAVFLARECARANIGGEFGDRAPRLRGEVGIAFHEARRRPFVESEQ